MSQCNMPCVVVHVSFCLNVKPHKNQMIFFVMSSYIKPTYLAYLGAMQSKAYKSDEFNSSKSFQRDQQHWGSTTGMSRGEALQTAPRVLAHLQQTHP